jgi:hypothetical protein
MLACLLRPLGSLGLAAVASGAFASLLQRWSFRDAVIPFDDLERYTKDQIGELVRFVEQVSPEALQQLGNVVADNPMGAAAVGASVAMLLLRALRVRGATVRKAGDEVKLPVLPRGIAEHRSLDRRRDLPRSPAPPRHREADVLVARSRGPWRQERGFSVEGWNTDGRGERSGGS